MIYFFKYCNIPAYRIFKQLGLVCFVNISVKSQSTMFFHIGEFIMLSVFKITKGSTRSQTRAKHKKNL
jgi:hypothetical protein